MGGTDPNNFLNSVGKIKTKSKKKEVNNNSSNPISTTTSLSDPEVEGDQHGDILLWKRRAEKYLVEVRSDVL